MIILFQILFVIFALFASASVISRKKSGHLGVRATFFWVGFWLLAIIVVVWPNSASMIASYLGIGRGADLILYVAVAMIFYLLFKMNVKIDSLNRDVTKVVRDNALKEDKHI